MLVEKYIPIDCGYYDELEKIATLRKKVTIVYHKAKAEEILNEVVIYDFKRTTDGEYLFAKDNSCQYQIRLDRLISVDGIVLSEYNSHSCGFNR